MKKKVDNLDKSIDFSLVLVGRYFSFAPVASFWRLA